jgi:hypothetical protein
MSRVPEQSTTAGQGRATGMPHGVLKGTTDLWSHSCYPRGPHTAPPLHYPWTTQEIRQVGQPARRPRHKKKTAAESRRKSKETLRETKLLVDPPPPPNMARTFWGSRSEEPGYFRVNVPTGGRQKRTTCRKGDEISPTGKQEQTKCSEW